jgi:tol-pal system protein YbgF
MRRLVAPLVALALAGCWVPAERGRVMEQRIARLEDENQLVTRQLEEQRELLRDRVTRADAKIAEVQAKLDELNKTAHRTGADVVARQDQLQQEILALRGQLEEAQHRSATLEGQLAASRQDTEGRFAALKGAGALEQFEARSKIAALAKPNEPVGLLALAREQDQAGERAVARELYDELTRRWPKDPTAADAHYRLGELAAADGRHREAVLSFGKVAQEFPRNERAPDAMLKTGDSLVALGLKPEAIGVYRELQTKYPKTPASRTAEAKIAELESRKAAPQKKK